jgi:hypothetical protein
MFNPKAPNQVDLSFALTCWISLIEKYGEYRCHLSNIYMVHRPKWWCLFLNCLTFTGFLSEIVFSSQLLIFFFAMNWNGWYQQLRLAAVAFSRKSPEENHSDGNKCVALFNHPDLYYLWMLLWICHVLSDQVGGICYGRFKMEFRICDFVTYRLGTGFRPALWQFYEFFPSRHKPDVAVFWHYFLHAMVPFLTLGWDLK